MLTQRLILVGDEAHDRPLIQQAAAIIRAGGLVAFPTETVYGLGADALNSEAVRRIFIAKGRPAWDPLIVHVDTPEAIRRYTHDHSELVDQLIGSFMPGALTLVLPKQAMISDVVTAGRDTVAIRIPQHPVARALIRYSGTPIAAPSANKFGRPSPTTADHVLHDLSGEIEAVLDAGQTPMGVESTILDLTTQPPTLLRPGGVPKEAIESVIGKVRVLGESIEEGTALPAPGLSARHYAPRAKVLLCAPTPDAFYGALKDALSQYPFVGAMRPDGWRVPDDPRLRVYEWGAWGDWKTLAHRLFAGLRGLEGAETHAIVCPLPPEEDLARALRDRLQRAAHGS
ncbi:MAG: L-threonylcarbamoyladenylate synthase [Fimbriimonadales bacterium]|nr:L-threonylcarbamoyladenylate synthase [Fimbriimonadales bacterium]